MKWMILVFVTGLSACGMFETEERAQTFTQIDQDLVGEWQSECIANDVLELTHAVRKVSFSALGDFTRTEEFYSGDGCEDLGLVVSVSGTFVAPDHQDNANNMLNLTVLKANVEVHHERAVGYINDFELCGMETWKVGEPQNIINQNCQGFELNTGDVIFERYLMEGDQLYLANNFMFLSEDSVDDRPDEADKNIGYHRQ